MLDLIPFVILFMIFLTFEGIKMIGKDPIVGMIAGFYLLVLGSIVIMAKLSYFGVEIDSGLPISLSMILFLFFIPFGIYIMYANALEL
jgi:hypothetical protein